MRKIIHVDMDCFYAAIEIRDRPELKNLPVAVGAAANQRGVLCTCNYVARRYGVHSAMPTATALRRCKELIVLPVDMPKYKSVAREVQAIFLDYTPHVEPLALDEAYLDVTDSGQYQGSATLIAKSLLRKIWDEQQLTASAGVAPNKFLAKIGSGWNKPNGLFVILPEEAEAFAHDLPVEFFFGVGKVTLRKLQALNIKTGADLKQMTLASLSQHFGKLGQRLYEQCRGFDHRKVETNREKKSLSIERTFTVDLVGGAACQKKLMELYPILVQRIAESAPERKIKNQYLKIKFSDFKLASVEMISLELSLDIYLQLLSSVTLDKRKVRLVGLGVNFQSLEMHDSVIQRSLF